MNIRYPIAAFVLIAGLAACSGGAAKPQPVSPAAANWRAMATTADRERLRDWRKTWMTALAMARTSDVAAIAAEGVLFDPDRALADPVPPAGEYRCRVFKLGANGTAMAQFTRKPDQRCRIERNGDVSSFYMLTGAQRPVGQIMQESASRAVLLGTLRIGDEMHQMHYGRDAQRDVAGLVERVEEKRWRLIFPSPRFESLLDVVELVPAG